jgi:hypothetical protein
MTLFVLGGIAQSYLKALISLYNAFNAFDCIRGIHLHSIAFRACNCIHGIQLHSRHSIAFTAFISDKPYNIHEKRIDNIPLPSPART